MNTGDFTLARQSVTGALIERMFGCEGSRWDGDEYKTLSPLRTDTRTGSFSIRRDGRWYDFATGEGGDFIDLVQRARNCPPLEAARYIVREAGSSPHSKFSKAGRVDRRRSAVVAVPAEASEGLRSACDNALTRTRYGRLVRHLALPSGGRESHLPRLQVRDGECQEKRSPVVLRRGRLMASGSASGSWKTPCFGFLELLESNLPVLIVEGEKCATVSTPPDFPFFISTWSGGAGATEKTDWTPLKDREVVVWPDADKPGREAAQRIKAKLPKARVLRVEGKPAGWDIADAVTESINVEAFIKDCPAEAEDGTHVIGLRRYAPRLVTLRARDIPTRAVEWLWEGRIPLGEYSVLVGHPSSGKSTFAAALAAHVSAGIPFPDGTKPVCRRRALHVCRRVCGQSSCPAATGSWRRARPRFYR